MNKINVQHKDFISVFSNVYPEGFCEHLVSEFERHEMSGAGLNRQQTDRVNKTTKDDLQLEISHTRFHFESFDDTNTKNLFFSGLQKCYESYVEKYSALEGIGTRCNNIKMQKTSSGGGYHVWHGEQGNDEQATRSLVYMLFLNSLPKEANGETEFLYQQRRINPVKNTMVLWPASFTHAHRGNPVFGDNNKYIVTGWFYNE